MELDRLVAQNKFLRDVGIAHPGRDHGCDRALARSEQVRQLGTCGDVPRIQADRTYCRTFNFKYADDGARAFDLPLGDTAADVDGEPDAARRRQLAQPADDLRRATNRHTGDLVLKFRLRSEPTIGVATEDTIDRA